MEDKKDICRLAEEFEECQKILLALGDENRQHLILEMMQMDHCEGVRVGTITEKTHLSRPAVSHHIQILKDAGLLKMRREGTRNYYFDADTISALQEEINTCNKKGNHVLVKPGVGFYSKIDMGIAKYHFEIGAGKDHFEWTY